MNNSAAEESAVAIKSLQLTQWGRLKLSAFPIEAIEYADSNFNRNQPYARNNFKASEPFKRFCDLCVEYCNANGIRPSWREMYEQARVQGMSLNAAMIVPQQATQKRGRENFNRAPISVLPSAGISLRPGELPGASAGQAPPPAHDPNIVHIGLTKCCILSDDETHTRQAAFISNPEAVAGIDNLAMLIGKENAHKYFQRVFDNLRYQEIP